MSAAGAGDPAPAQGPVPLVALLGRSEAAFIAEFDRRIRESAFCALSLAHSRNVLRHLADGPLRASRIVERCDVSKQAISQQITHLEANGYVRVEVDPDDQRARVVSLTDKGVRAQEVVRGLFEQIEHDWSQALGCEDIAALRRILTKSIEVIPGGSCAGLAPSPASC